MILIVVDFNLHGSNRPPHVKIPSYAPVYVYIYIYIFFFFIQSYLARQRSLWLSPPTCSKSNTNIKPKAKSNSFEDLRPGKK